MPERSILITGAAQGIGRALALHLAAPKTLLLLHYHRSAAAAETLAAAARRQGAKTVLLQADLACPQAREQLMSTVAEQSVALQVLINNASIYDERSLLAFSPSDWQRILDIGCSAVFDLTQRALPLLRQGAPGRVINLGDSGADRIIARTRATPYHIAKLGVHVLTRSYARLLAAEGITVNQLSPGFMENSIGEPAAPPPAGRKGAPADLLPALDYLLSPQAQYVTGANIVISGGWNL